MKVRDLGLKEVYSIASTASLNEVAALMKRHGIGIVPVCAGDHVVGMITDRDMVVGCVSAGMNPASCQVNEFMTSEPVAVAPDMDVEEAAEIMSREQIRRLPVIKEGKLVGIISLGDVAMALTDDSLVAETLRRISTPIKAVPPASI